MICLFECMNNESFQEAERFVIVLLDDSEIWFDKKMSVTENLTKCKWFLTLLTLR